MSVVGKRVVDDLYLHISAIDQLSDPEHRQRVELALRRLPASRDMDPNVVKLNVRTGRLSLLVYPTFDDDPFPALEAGWMFAAEGAAPPTFRSYADCLNPPILHRKELLVSRDHPERVQWCQLTETAESLGLFDDPATIGFKLNWERLIAQKGYQLSGDELVPMGNAMYSGMPIDDAAGDAVVQRHLTALVRSNLSAPVQLLLRHGMLAAGSSFFDYGCGRGDDVAGLVAGGFEARGWDPYFAAEQTVVEADVVNLGFVVNVIEDAAERVEALRKAFALTRRVMSVGVMLYGSEPAGRPYRDGFLTSRNTFQKYFTQAEVKDYVEQVLHREAFMVGPGVAFVFADQDLEQRYSAGRYRSRGVAARLLAARVPRPPRVPRVARARDVKVAVPPRQSRAEAELMRVRPLLDALWTTALDLGRLPEPEEVSDLEALVAELGSLSRALRLLERHYDPALLAAAATTRSDDVRLYLAVQQFSRRPAYRQLERRLQTDIKAFFGDYRSAQASGLALLQEAADSSRVLAACRQAAANGLGWLESDHSLQLHVSLVERLPVVLRAYVACGLVLWDALGEVQLIKIHIESGKLTLMEFDDFDASPVPALRKRIKVNIRKQDYDVFEYGSREFPKPLLYRKSRYLHEDSPGFAEQQAFDEALEATGILGDSEFGPSPTQLNAALEARRLGIQGMRLGRSERIPDLDQRCGERLTYRQLIECGETQQRTQLRNVPLNPATYNALFDLATQVLDPVVDYFGSIRLTYGFCSAELGRHITRRVAPKLDQHASWELNRAGKLICERGGAACDFLVEDEDMGEVAEWVMKHTPFDRLYFYGADRPIHVSYSDTPSQQAYRMVLGAGGQLLPRPFAR